MKNRFSIKLAQTLRQIAHKLQPEWITSLDVKWERDRQPHVDIRFRDGQHVTGYVDHVPKSPEKVQ